MKKLVMELIGTFFFIFSIACGANPVAIGCMLMVWIYIGAYVSGAHYNPLISFAMALRGRLRWNEFPWYALAQVAGGFLAYAITYTFQIHARLPRPAAPLLYAFGMEILLAFMFASIVLAVATMRKYREAHIFGFAIGFAVPALAAVGAPVSGGLFNPAIALGSYLFAAFKHVPVVWNNVAMYVGGAFIGAAIAVYVFEYLVPVEER